MCGRAFRTSNARMLKRTQPTADRRRMGHGKVALLLSALTVGGGCATTPRLNTADAQRCEALLPSTSTWNQAIAPKGQAMRDLGKYVIPPAGNAPSRGTRRIGWYSASSSSGEKRYAACTVEGPPCNETITLVAAERGITMHVDADNEITFWTILDTVKSTAGCPVQ